MGGVIVEQAAFDIQVSTSCDRAAFSANIAGKFTFFDYSGPAVTYSSAPSYIADITEHKAVGHRQNPGLFIQYPSTAAPVIIDYPAL